MYRRHRPAAPVHDGTGCRSGLTWSQNGGGEEGGTTATRPGVVGSFVGIVPHPGPYRRGKNFQAMASSCCCCRPASTASPQRCTTARHASATAAPNALPSPSGDEPGGRASGRASGRDSSCHSFREGAVPPFRHYNFQLCHAACICMSGPPPWIREAPRLSSAPPRRALRPFASDRNNLYFPREKWAQNKLAFKGLLFNSAVLSFFS